jgi:hypothetical protein
MMAGRARALETTGRMTAAIPTWSNANGHKMWHSWRLGDAKHAAALQWCQGSGGATLSIP